MLLFSDFKKLLCYIVQTIHLSLVIFFQMLQCFVCVFVSVCVFVVFGHVANILLALQKCPAGFPLQKTAEVYNVRIYCTITTTHVSEEYKRRRISLFPI